MQIGSYDFLDSYFNSTLFNPNFGRPLIFQPAEPNVQLYNIQMLLAAYFLLHPKYNKAFSRIAGGNYKCVGNICRIKKSQLFSIYSDYKQYFKLQDMYLYKVSLAEDKSTYITSVETNSTIGDLMSEVRLKGFRLAGDKVYTLYNSNGELIARIQYIDNTGEIKFVQFDRRLVIELAQKLLDKYGMTLLKYASFPIPVSDKEAQVIPFTRFYQDVYLQYYPFINIERAGETSVSVTIELEPVYIYTPVGDTKGEIVSYSYKDLQSRGRQNLLEILAAFLTNLLNHKGLLPAQNMSQYEFELEHFCKAYIEHELQWIDLKNPLTIDKLVTYCVRIAIVLRALLNSEK